MTPDKITTEEVDEVEAALDLAKVFYLKMLRAQAARNKIGEETSQKVAKAKAVYEKVVTTEQAKVVQSDEAEAAARQALLDHQAEVSRELHIDLNVIPQPGGGSRTDL